MEPTNSPITAHGPAILPANYLANVLRNSVGPTEFPVAPRQRAVAYLRRSKKQENDSIERQRERAIEYAKNIGVEIEQFYIDTSITGEVWRRKAFQQMLADGKDGRFTILIVEEVDRIGRNMSSIAGLFDTFTQIGIAIHSITKGAAIAPIDVAFRGFLATEHQTLLRARISAGINRVVTNGKFLALPFGYCKVPDRPGERCIDEKARPIVEWIFQAKLDGMTIHQIAKALSEKGAHFAPNDQKWSYKRVRAMFDNMMYAGILTFYRTKQSRDPDTEKVVKTPTHPSAWMIREVPHLAIVSRETWQAAYETIKHHSTHKKRGTTFLSSKIRCEHCGEVMRAVRRAGRTWSYRCAPAVEVGKLRVCNGVGMRFATDLVLKSIRALLEDENLEDRFRAEINARHKRAVAALEERRAELTRRLHWLGTQLNDQLSEAIVANFPHDLVMRRTRAMKDEYELAQAQLAEMPIQTARAPLDANHMRTLHGAFDDLVEAIHQECDHGTRPTREHRQMIETLKQMITDVTCKRIPGTRSITVTASISPMRVFGLRTDPSAEDARALSFSATDQNFQTKSNDMNLIAAFGEGLYATTDDEFEAFMSGVAPERRNRLGCSDALIRRAIDMALFLSTTHLTYFRFKKILPRDQFKELRVALNRLTASKRTRVWQDFLRILDQRFPSRYRTLDPLHFEHPFTRN